MGQDLERDEIQQRIQVTLTIDDGAGAGKALEYLLRNGFKPRDVVRELLALHYAPLAVPERCRSNVFNRTQAVSAFFGLQRHAYLIQEAYDLNIINIEIDPNSMLP